MKSIIFLILIFIGDVYAQDLSLPIGSTTENEGGATLVKGPSGDYFIGGYSEEQGLISRVDISGNTIWSKSLDFGEDPDYIMELDITSDNYIIGCGNARTGASFNAYGFVFKMDLDGNIIWKRIIECDGLYMWTNGLLQSSNGNYRVVGAYKNVRQNNYIIEYNATTGVQVWDTVYVRSNIANSWDENFYDIVSHPTNNADYIAGRFQKAGSNTTYRPSLTKLNDLGHVEWSKTYIYNDGSGGGRYYAWSIDKVADGLVMGVLCKDGGSSPPFETGLIKTSLDGDLLWGRRFVSPGNDLRSYNMVATPDGFLITGWIEAADKSLFMIKTNTVGEVLWAKSYGGIGDEDMIVASSNSRVIVDDDYAVTVGRTTSFSGTFDVFLLRVDLATGQLTDGSCYEDLTIVEYDLPEFEADYPMQHLNLPITSTDPIVLVEDLEFDFSGDLFDFVADTLIGGDTIYFCGEDELILYTSWPETCTFLWSTGGTDALETVSEEGVYWISVAGEGGCVVWSDTVTVLLEILDIDLGPDTSICDADSFLLTVEELDGVTYLWNDGSDDNELLADADGLYWVTATKDECVVTDSINVAFGFATLDIGPDVEICNSEVVILDADNPGATFLWNDGSIEQTLSISESGIYWVMMNNGECTLIDSMTLSVSDLIVELPNDTTICTGETIVLDAGLIDGTYLWNDGSNSRYFTVTESGTYAVTVSNGDCEYTDEITILFSSVNASFNGFPLTGCAPLETQFNDLSNASSDFISEWHWYFGDGSESFVQNPIHNYTSAGLYTVTLAVVSSFGCSDDTTIVNYVSVSETATAEFDYTPVIAEIDEVINFTSYTTNTTSWHWDFGDGTYSNDQHPTHLFSTAGEFNVTLEATNEDGCNGIVSHKVIIESPINIYVPNVFTPDGDDFNEHWKPILYGIDFYDFHLVLYNRWGETIWESFNANVGWDGSYGGVLVQDGVYVWVIEYGELLNDNQHKITGHLTVIK